MDQWRLILVTGPNALRCKPVLCLDNINYPDAHIHWEFHFIFIGRNFTHIQIYMRSDCDR